MALFSRRDLFNGQALVASAAKIPNGPEGKPAKPREWQQEAWLYYDQVGEVWFAMNYLANALRRIRLFPASQPDPQEAPQPVEDSAANAELDRLRGVDGGHGQILHDAGLQLSVVGECYLALFADPDPLVDGDEVAGIFSTSELEKKADGWYLKEGAFAGEGRRLVDPVVNRIWRPHPRYKAQADSSMRALGGVFSELLILDRQYRSLAKSRIGAGVAFVPDEVRLKAAEKSPTGDGFVDAFLTALVTPQADEDSALNVAPGVIKAPGDRIEQFRFEKFGREYDPATAARYDKVLERIATGLDLPKAIVLGIEDLNHWSSWLVDEDAFDSHLAPLVELICSGLTEAFLRPSLGSEDVFVWYDASALIAHPQKADQALDAVDKGLISDEAGRRYLGYSEDDAPSPEETAAKLERRRALQPPQVPGGPVQGPPAEDGTPVTASAARVALGLELAMIDQELLTSLQAACEGVVQRALAKAGRQLRARIPEGSTITARVEGVDDRFVAVTLGPGVVHAFASDDELTDDSALPVVGVFHKHVARAQRKVRGILRQQGANSDQLDELEEAQTGNRERGAGVLAASLKGIVAALLFGALPGKERGEASDFTVPAGVVREALAAAGGSHAPTAMNPVTDQPQGGVATGDDAMALFAELGNTPDAWEWVHGDPARPFEPHLALDGVRFLDWQDPVLSVTDDATWLGTDYLFPGDHAGCTCWFAPVFGDA